MSWYCINFLIENGCAQQVLWLISSIGIFNFLDKWPVASKIEKMNSKQCILRTNDWICGIVVVATAVFAFFGLFIRFEHIQEYFRIQQTMQVDENNGGSGNSYYRKRSEKVFHRNMIQFVPLSK